MDGSIRLSAAERKRGLQVYRGSGNARVARRAHVLLLLDDGRSWREVMQILYMSSETIARIKARYEAAGLDAALANPDEQPPTLALWQVIVAVWLLQKTPQDFGFCRRRWSCEMLSVLLEEDQGLRRSPETVRRALHALGFAWRRPRPVVGPTDPDYERKLQDLRELLAHLPPDETAVFQDEVDVHLNPKLGACWMIRGAQAEVVTPGNNVKRHLAGSLVWGTGTLIVSPPQTRRNTALFLAHLDDLRRRLRGARKIHVICDNASFHRSRPVRDYLARWGHRLQLHFLPRYSPETNPIERVWWHLHETVTRNHRCRTMEELLAEVYEYFALHNNHYLEMHTNAALAA